MLTSVLAGAKVVKSDGGAADEQSMASDEVEARMTVAEEQLEREQQSVMPQEDLRPYAGQWVAIRDGRVVAHELDSVSLHARSDVRDDDVLMPVPAASSGTYIL